MRTSATAALSGLLLAACTPISSSASDGGLAGDGGLLDVSAGDAGGDDAADSESSDAAPLDDFAWAQSFQASFGSTILAMASDATSVVIAGQILGTATLGKTTLTTADSAGNAFVAKLDTSGNVLWAQIASGASSDFEAVAIDASGNIVVSGNDFGDGPSVTFGGTTLTPDTTGTIGGHAVGSSAGILFAMDPTGAVKWSTLVETTGEVNLGSLAFSGTTLFAAGPINDDAAFASGGGSPITGCGTDGCVFLAAWGAADGTLQWAKEAPSAPPRVLCLPIG